MEENKKNIPQTTHHVLAHSYSVYFIALLVGVALHLVFKEHIMSENARYVGFFLLPVATLLIIWSQNTSEKLNRVKQEKGRLETADFYRGPYCVSRSPTHWGLVLLIIGLGFLLN